MAFHLDETFSIYNSEGEKCVRQTNSNFTRTKISKSKQRIRNRNQQEIMPIFSLLTKYTEGRVTPACQEHCQCDPTEAKDMKQSKLPTDTQLNVATTMLSIQQYLSLDTEKHKCLSSVTRGGLQCLAPQNTLDQERKRSPHHRLSRK